MIRDSGNRPFRMQYDTLQPNAFTLCGSSQTRTGRPTRRSAQCRFPEQITSSRRSPTRINAPLVRRHSCHEGTASDSRGNHTAMTAAPPRSPRRRAARPRGRTPLERRRSGPPDTPFVYHLFFGPNCRWTSDEVDENVCGPTSRVVSKSPPSWWSLLIGLSHSDVEYRRRRHTFFYLYDSCCATASTPRRIHTWEWKEKQRTCRSQRCR